MKQAKQFWGVLRSSVYQAMGLIIVAFFGGYALFGSNGVLAGFEYRQQLELRQLELQAIRVEQRELANRVALLNPNRADPDLVDEMVRRDLGLAHPDEVVIPLD
jgi:cell division protein FtsB